jgi:ribose-phosphate pyrophosphokinase
MDLHQGQIQGFFNIPVDELTAVHLLSRHFINMQLEDCVVVTDLGFAKRARTFAELLNAPLAIIEKRRVGNLDRAELMNVIGDVRGKRAIIVRDSSLREVVITDSIPLPASKRIPKITILSVAPLIGEAIKRIHRGESVGALFSSEVSFTQEMLLWDDSAPGEGGLATDGGSGGGPAADDLLSAVPSGDR